MQFAELRYLMSLNGVYEIKCFSLLILIFESYCSVTIAFTSNFTSCGHYALDISDVFFNVSSCLLSINANNLVTRGRGRLKWIQPKI